MWGWDARHRGAGQEVREGGLYSLQSTTKLAYTPASTASHCSTTPHHTPLQVTREADKVTTQQSTGQQLVCLWVLKILTGAPHHITSLVPTCMYMCTQVHTSTSCHLTTATAATAAAAATMEAWWEGEALEGIPTACGRWAGPWRGLPADPMDGGTGTC